MRLIDADWILEHRFEELADYDTYDIKEILKCVPTVEQKHIITKDYLDKIRKILINKIFRNPDIMFSDSIRGEDEYYVIDLIEVITDLYELLHKEIYNEPYDYMFHWANKIGAWVDTGNFLKMIDDENNDSEVINN